MVTFLNGTRSLSSGSIAIAVTDVVVVVVFVAHDLTCLPLRCGGKLECVIVEGIEMGCMLLLMMEDSWEGFPFGFIYEH
jgi:hypothetical protein